MRKLTEAERKEAERLLRELEEANAAYQLIRPKAHVLGPTPIVPRSLHEWDAADEAKARHDAAYLAWRAFWKRVAE